MGPIIILVVYIAIGVVVVNVLDAPGDRPDSSAGAVTFREWMIAVWPYTLLVWAVSRLFSGR